jgi:hypothetical protein
MGLPYEEILRIEENLEKVLTYAGCSRFNRDGSGKLRCAPPNSQNMSRLVLDLDRFTGTVWGEGTMRLTRLLDNFVNGSQTEEGGIEVIADALKLCPIKITEPLRGISSIQYVVAQQKRQEWWDEASKYDEDKIYKIPLKRAVSGYIPKSHRMFSEDGIPAVVAMRYKVHYCPYRDAIMLPHFHPIEDVVVGIQGRYCNPVEVMDKLFGKSIKNKYFNAWVGFHKGWFLYGLNFNLEHINEAKRMYIFESEKSVMKLSCREHTGVALGGHHRLSKQQIVWIATLTNPEVEVIICFDSDVEAEFSSEVAAQISRVRKCSFTYDEEGLLPDKDSPIDCGFEVFDKLIEARYDAKEHMWLTEEE